MIYIFYNYVSNNLLFYFSNATHIIGAIDCGISNVLFSPKNTKLEAIVSPTFLNVNMRFKYSLDNIDVYLVLHLYSFKTPIFCVK
jgi:hypothetical protein